MERSPDHHDTAHSKTAPAVTRYRLIEALLIESLSDVLLPPLTGV